MVKQVWDLHKIGDVHNRKLNKLLINGLIKEKKWY